MNHRYPLSTVFFLLMLLSAYGQQRQFLSYSQELLNAVEDKFGTVDAPLYREHYPFDGAYRADYLGTEARQSNQYSYLWPFSGVLSAQTAQYKNQRSKAMLQQIKRKSLRGMEMYRDERNPIGYASYIQEAPTSDRFYDDNVWLGIDMTDLYLLTKEPMFLEKAKLIWAFVASGMDDRLGGGIYWCEQRKESKNTCSNAPGAVFALKLFQATGDQKFLDLGESLYSWTKENLQDVEDGLYFDHITLDGRIGKAKFSYNSGQMLEAAALLYLLKGENTYLEDAERIAQSSFQYFFDQDTKKVDFPLLKNGNVWFHAVMLRGFVALAEINKNQKYLDAFRANMQYAWQYLRDTNGFFGDRWDEEPNQEKKWLLNQFAMAEMFARLAL